MNISFPELIWISLVAGFIGTAGMTIFLQIVTWTGLAHADIVRAVGSLFTKSINSAGGIGMFAHFISGILFAFFYAIIIVLFGIDGVFRSTVAGLVIGFIHGFVVSFLLVVAVAEHHPLPQFRNPGLSVAVAHYAGHIIYGFLVGLIIGIMM
jgi:hypothetical protein